MGDGTSVGTWLGVAEGPEKSEKKRSQYSVSLLTVNSEQTMRHFCDLIFLMQ